MLPVRSPGSSVGPDQMGLGRRKILRSRVFDAGWYVVAYPEVGRQGWDPRPTISQSARRKA